MWLHAPNINCRHGFSTRYGGVSKAPFHELNLGGSQDIPTSIEQNRKIAMEAIGLAFNSLCLLKQVHGSKVCPGEFGCQEGDALVSNQTGKTLAVSIADCYPILFQDSKNGVIAAAHAGWRGTLAGIAGKVIQQMIQLGAETSAIQVAIGQGISQQNFEVGAEVVDLFLAEKFPNSCIFNSKIDLITCNKHVLKQHNIPDSNIWSMNRCTFEDEFFSYRRDKGITGRMWAVIAQ